jgi:hypothetical protein
MNNARHILMQLLAVIGSSRGTERFVDDFCTWIEAQVMTDLMRALPMDKQNQLIDKFLALPQHEKESAFYPYYTGEHMRERLKDATKTAIVKHIVEPHSKELSQAQRDTILSLLEQLTC